MGTADSVTRMQLRNGGHGYGVVTKLLHWVTVLAIALQFGIGLSMDADAGVDRAEDQVDAFEDRSEERAEERGEAVEQRLEAEAERRNEVVDALPDSAGTSELTGVVTGGAFTDGLSGIEAHLLIGLVVAALGLVRLVWRRCTPLPPWAQHLGPAERSFESRAEKALMALLLIVPATGLLIVLAGEQVVAMHIAAQLVLVLAVALHVGLVLKHTVLRRNRHLARML